MNELTDSEREQLAVITQVRTSASIGSALCLSPKTVATHISHIFAKVGLRDSAEHLPRVLAGLALTCARVEFRAHPYSAPG
jgi:DNA-binding NarL/FixJ family response regulator